MPSAIKEGMAIYMSDYRALYRKYRPVDFDDVSGQKSITDILKYQVESGKLSHAYLFCGSRGTGKTSCAKILAKAVNCENPINGNPCNRCEACRSIDSGIATDVIEMDAASNNGVGNVRDMKDEIAFTPALLKYRVYIIDEVHMMSGSAFNALLKTLEEPPAYVIFILATTEFHKLPTTIVSRCQRYDFRRMTTDVIIERLRKISERENIDLGDDGAAMLARVAEGGMRDAVSLLELCAGAGEHIDAELVYNIVGRGSREGAYTFMERLLRGEVESVYASLGEIIVKGSDIGVFWNELIDAYRDLMVVKSTSDAKSYLDLTDAEHSRLLSLASSTPLSKLIYHTSVLEETVADLQRSRESQRSIAEIALTKICMEKLECSKEALLYRIEELEKSVSKLKLGIGVPPTASQKEIKEQKQPDASEDKTAQITVPQPTSAHLSADSSPVPYKKWGRVVGAIETMKPAIYVLLSKAVALVAPEHSFTIKVDMFFVNTISSNAENMAIIRGLLAEIEGVAPEKINIKVVPKDSGERATLADELEDAINN